MINADPKLTTSVLCATSAAFILAQQQRDQTAHSIEVPANPALQLLDAITLNDQAAPLGSGISSTARICKSSVHFLPEKATFIATINLEGV